MKVVIQKVSEASVSIAQKKVANIQHGLVVLLGIHPQDSVEDILWLCKKIVNMRLFEDENGVNNLSVKEVLGDIIVVSQFTLYAQTKKGNRPSYTQAAKPEIAIPLYEQFKAKLAKQLEKPIQSGQFGAHMQITLTNNGPVTICMDTLNKT